MVTFERPLRATHHCRHYRYETGLGGGPRCALGIDNTGRAANQPCMPAPYEGQCGGRAEYTDAERTAWQTYLAASLQRLGKAVQALPVPIPPNTSGKVKCPNCEGDLHYARWHRGAEIKCTTTANCCGPVHFSIAAGKDWPAGGAHGGV